LAGTIAGFGRDSEQRRTVTKSMLALKTMPKTGHIRTEQHLTMLNQRHLRRQVVTLENFNVIPMVTKTDVISPAIIRGTVQPEGVHSRPLQEQHSGDCVAWP
jgi:hypothetical protein